MQDHTTRRSRKTIPASERFWKYITPAAFTDCWEWQGALRNGYGVLNVGGKVIYCHRLSYELHFGPLPEGCQACHHCDNRKCCNPYHLFAGTQGDNMRDMYAKGRGNNSGNERGSTPKITEEQVRAIRDLADQGVRYPDIAKIYNITVPAISLIVTRKRWKHVT